MRKLIRTVIGFVFYYLSVTRLLLFLTELLAREKTLVAFVYHRVTDRGSGDVGYLIYDLGIDFHEFDIQVAAIKRYFRIVGASEYVECVSGTKRPEKRLALLTFDDADSDFIKCALPVLKKYDCKAVVFAPTDFIGTERRFWHLRLTNLIHNVGLEDWKAVQEHASRFPGQIAELIRRLSVSDDARRGEACRALAHALDQIDAREVDSLVAELERIAGAEYTLGVTCMNWEQLAEVSRQGVAIESHTVTHRKLALLDEETITHELVESKRILEQRLGGAVTTICYPAGSFNDAVVAAASRAGYQAGFTTRHGLGAYALPEDERFRLRRISMYGSSRYEADFYLARMILRRIVSGRAWN